MFEACFKDSYTNILIIVSIYGREACTSNCAQLVAPSSALPMQQVPKVQEQAGHVLLGGGLLITIVYKR